MLSIAARLRAGQNVVGTWLFHNNPVWVEIATSLGIDFILVDLEHGQVEMQHLPGLLRAASLGPTTIIVRTLSDDPKLLSKMLDIGVQGVIVPKVDNADQAAAVVRACRYPPIGDRGLAIGAVRASRYGLIPNYRTEADADILVGVQIESGAAIVHADAISAVEGLDLVFVGPNDLTANLGFMDHCDESAAIVTELLQQLSKGPKPTGTIPYHTVDRAMLENMGVNFIVAGSDVTAQLTALRAFMKL